MNANYQKGRRAEYLAKQILQDAGFEVLRAAGSKGRFDLVAFAPTEPVLMVQIKATSSPSACQALLKAFQPDSGEHYLSQIWVYHKGQWSGAGSELKEKVDIEGNYG